MNYRGLRQWCWAELRSWAAGGIFSGTLIGLFFLSILQNGMHLLAMPSELTGVLTGVLLLCVVAVDRLRARRGARAAGEGERPTLKVAAGRRDSSDRLLWPTLLFMLWD